MEIPIAIGSKRDFKETFVKNFFISEFTGNRISSERIEVDTGVAKQPLSIEETLKGAENRSGNVLTQREESDFGIGLEGGVYEDPQTHKLYLIEAAAITIKTGIPTMTSGISDPILLPDEIRDKLKSGQLLSTATQEYLESQGREVSISDIKEKGTAFYVSENKISRESMITQALERAMKKLDTKLDARNSK